MSHPDPEPMAGMTTAHDVPGAPRAVSTLVRRGRFIDWMTANTDAPVRMICGGAGSGKTSALLGWARERTDGNALWITLDSDLTGRSAFWSLVTHHLARLGIPVDPALEVALLDPAAPAGSIPVLLIRQFDSAGDLTLIIDNGDLAVGSEIAADVIRLLDHVSSFRVVFTTRTAPGETQVERDLGSRVAVSPPDLMALDSEEVEQLASSSGVVLRQDQIGDLLSLTRGWALAVKAELSTLADTAAVVGHEPGSATRDLGLRLLSRFRSDPAFSRLRRHSIGPWISGVDIDDDLAALLDDLAEVGLGSWEDTPSRRFRLQPVLQKMLRAEFEDAEPRAARAEHLAIAESHLARDEYSTAFGAAVRAEAWPLAARIYIRHVLSITSRPAMPLLTSHRVPVEAQRSQPVLAMAVAIDDFANRRRARAVRGLSQLLQRIDRDHLTGRRVSVDDVWTQAVVTMSRRLLGQHEAAKASLRRVHRMLERVDDPNGDLDSALSMFLSQGALVALLADDRHYAGFYLSEAGITRLPDSSPSEEARLHGIRALVSVMQGEVNDARDLLDRRSRLPLPDSTDQSYTALPAMLASARVRLEEAEPGSAERMLAHTSVHAPTTDLWPLLIHCATLVRWHRHGAGAALTLLDDELEKREGRFSAGSIALLPLTALRAHILLAQGRTDAARHVLTSSPRHRSRRFQLTRARIDLADGDLHRAAGRAAVGLRSARGPRERQSFAIVAAAAALRLGDHEHARIHSALAARLARVHGVALPLTGVPRRDAEALLQTEIDVWPAVSAFAVFPPSPAPAVRLTPRERVVLHAIMETGTVAEMSRRLSVSENTVKSQLRSLYRKLDVTTRSDALDEARRRGLL